MTAARILALVLSIISMTTIAISRVSQVPYFRRDHMTCTPIPNFLMPTKVISDFRAEVLALVAGTLLIPLSKTGSPTWGPSNVIRRYARKTVIKETDGWIPALGP